jgi:hypothetical protein
MLSMKMQLFYHGSAKAQTFRYNKRGCIRNGRSGVSKLAKEENGKILGETRREFILSRLKEQRAPLTGKELAEETHVSRQVIVQDVSLLKARGAPIIATSRGYLYMGKGEESGKQKRVIAVQHEAKDTETELYTLVDHGVTVVDVTVEHPIYGDLTGALMLENRRDVDVFLREVEKTEAGLLSMLTGGVHLHTIEAKTKEQLDEATDALRQAGILLENQ